MVHFVIFLALNIPCSCWSSGSWSCCRSYGNRGGEERNKDKNWLWNFYISIFKPSFSDTMHFPKCDVPLSEWRKWLGQKATDFYTLCEQLVKCDGCFISLRWAIYVPTWCHKLPVGYLDSSLFMFLSASSDVADNHFHFSRECIIAIYNQTQGIHAFHSSIAMHTIRKGHRILRLFVADALRDKCEDYCHIFLPYFPENVLRESVYEIDGLFLVALY